MNTCKRKICNNEISEKENARRFGESSMITTMGYCSAQCYTKDTINPDLMSLTEDALNKFDIKVEEDETIAFENLMSDIKYLSVSQIAKVRGFIKIIKYGFK